MTQPIHSKQEFSVVGRAMLDNFSAIVPHERFHYIVLRSLDRLLAERDCYDGQLGGWAGGLVYAAAQHRPDFERPLGYLNSQLETIFGVPMSTIRKRAEQLWSAIFPKAASPSAGGSFSPDPETQAEIAAISAAFRGGWFSEEFCAFLASAIRNSGPAQYDA